jgi:hypothetical protein
MTDPIGRCVSVAMPSNVPATVKSSAAAPLRTATRCLAATAKSIPIAALVSLTF